MSIFRWRYYIGAIAALTISCSNSFAQYASCFANDLGCNTNVFTGATNLIYVATNGSDTNSGSAAAPFLTIQKAATTAQTASLAGIGSTIIIMPGTYRENVLYDANSGSLVQPVVFSAATNGTVVISGADAWTNGWTLVSGTTFEHSWTNTWGLAPVPSGWSGVLTQEIVQLFAVVMVNGDLYPQVLTNTELTAGTFCVDTNAHEMYVDLPSNVVESNAFFEVAQRTNIMTVTQSGSYTVANVALQGLEFREAAVPLPYSAVEFYSASNILVNACTFDWNNWCGINFDFGRNITIQDSVGSHNGAMGMQLGNHEKNIVVDGCETDFNNWRGFPSFTGFSIAGIKALNIHNGLFQNHVAVGNLTYGLWFDYDNSNVCVEGCVYDGNLLSGLQFEATEGPALVEGCVSSRGYGSQLALLCQNAQQLTVTNTALISSGNVTGQGDIGCTVSTSRTVTNWETLEGYTLYSSDWTLKDSLFRCGGGFQYGLYMATNFTNFLATLSSDFNHWCNFFQVNLFTLDGGTIKSNLPQWQALSGQDLHSESNNLLTVNPDIQDTYITLNDTNTNGNGGDTNALCDTTTDGTGPLDVILLKFNLSNMTNIPREAELRMSALVFTNTPIFYVYQMTTDWGTNATYSEAKPGVSWASGNFSTNDYITTPVRIGSIGTTNTGTLNTFADVTPLAQNWASGVSSNFGVAIMAQPTWNQSVNDGSNYRQFTIVTGESLLTNQWPVLASQDHGSSGCPTITLSPSTLPTGTVNTAYETTTITASGGASPYTFTNNPGSLPTGLSLSSSGVVSGTPTTPGTSQFTIQVTDSNQCTVGDVYTIVVNPVGCPTITLSPSTLPTGAVGWVYETTTITASGGASPYTYTNSAGALPAGLSLSSAGVLSGTTTTAGTKTFTVQATDADTCTGSNSYTVVVSTTGVCPTITLSPSTLPTGTVNTAYNQTITASGGIGPYAFTKSSGTLPAGLSLSSAGVLSGTPTASGSYMFTVQAADTNGCTGSASYTLVMVCPTITVSPSMLPTGRVNVAYNTQTMSASGGAGSYTFTNSVGTFPNGLTLSSLGVLSGTPTVAVTNTVTIQATDADACTGSNTYTLLIEPACSTITLSPSTLPAGTVGTVYSQTITASGGVGSYTYTNSAGMLPSGLTLSSAGTLSGTPTTAGTNTFTVQATDANGCTGSNSYTVVMALGTGAVFLDFNTGTTDFTGNFYSNGGVFTWNSTIGVTNGGGVKCSTTDETAIYKSNHWNLATNGASMTLSSFIRSTNSGASVQNALGVSTVTNGQFKSAAAGNWLTFYLSTESGFSQAKIGYQYQTGGTASTNVNLGSSFTLLQTNWYKWTVTFSNTNGASGFGTGSVVLDNYGAKGTNFVTNVVTVTGVSFNNVAQSVFESATNYPGIRAWTSSGLAGFDNWSVTAP